MKLSVPERGSSRITSTQWKSIADHRGFWELVGSGIIGIETDKRGGWRLSGNCYVGRAQLGNVIVEVREKFPGSFQSLLNLGNLTAPKITAAPSSATTQDDSTPFLISLFLEAARKYLSGHKVTQYVETLERGVLASGRLKLRETIQLRARGISHQIAFSKQKLSADNPINRVIYAALRQVEQISQTVTISQKDIASARALSILLDECRSSVWRALPGSLQKAAIEEFERKFCSGVSSEATSLAVAVLDSSGFGGTIGATRTVDRSWFVNLETQFEIATRKGLAIQLASTNYSVTSAIRRPALFEPDPGRYRANPDFVIQKDDSVIAVGDAKYKHFEGWPNAADVHELIAHAAAYKAGTAFFIFPTENQMLAKNLGASATGCDVWAFGVRFNNFYGDLDSVVRMTGISPTSDPLLPNSMEA